MDTGYTYSTGQGIRASLYVPPGVEPPNSLSLAIAGQPTTFHRISDRDLFCEKVPGIQGECTTFECHRAVLGECQCGRHEAPVPFRPVGR